MKITRWMLIAMAIGLMTSVDVAFASEEKKGEKPEICACKKPKGTCAECKKETAQKLREEKTTGKSIKVELVGLHCEGCEMTVREQLEKVPGVKSAKVSHKSQSAVVVYEKAAPKNESLIAAVKRAGYKVKRIVASK